MKKELFAALILAALAGLSIWNLKHVKTLTSDISASLQTSYSLAAEGNWEQAARVAEKSADSWSGSDGYTHIFIRHSEVDLTADAFGDYLSEIYRQDIGGAQGALHKLLEHLENIYAMERVTFKSVF